VRRRVGDGERDGGGVALADDVDVGVLDEEAVGGAEEVGGAETDPRAVAEVDAEADAAEAAGRDPDADADLDSDPDELAADTGTHVVRRRDVKVGEGDVVAPADADAVPVDDAVPVAEDEAPPAEVEPEAVEVTAAAAEVTAEPDGDSDGDGAQGVGVAALGCVAPVAPTAMRTGTVAEAMAATRTATVRRIVRRAWSMLGLPSVPGVRAGRRGGT
jgi:hypothetical protein